MSEKLTFTGPLRPIDRTAASFAQARVEASPRHRAIARYHDHHEAVQRMLNAVEPASYVRPHRHADPAKVEVFVVLTGRAVVLTFDDEGTLQSTLEIAAGGPCWGVEIPPGTWHSLISLEAGTVLYEVIEGAYQPASHKDYAPWAPAEGTEEGQRYLEALRAGLSRVE
ncbi:WbuC family cupin fold metalloprotein [bacterium]|nr:WbuC family cupin fold metalloprotein [bacterium]